MKQIAIITELSKTCVWYRIHCADLGWSDWKTNWETEEEKEKKKEEQIFNAWKSLGYTNEQIAQINYILQEETVTLREEYWRLLVIDLPEVGNNISRFYHPKKKEIYQSEYRVKSNVKNYGFMPNFRGLMYCIGNRGNYRRY